jgi:hypothetical protein
LRSLSGCADSQRELAVAALREHDVEIVGP